MTPCPLCGHSPSRMPLVVAVLAVLVIASWAGVVLALWDIRNIRDELSRRPQAAFFSVSGQYPHIRVYPEGWDVAEPEHMLEAQKKGNGKKKHGGT